MIVGRFLTGLACCLCTQLASADQSYSPYADVHYPTRVLWGDTHLHTTNSLDARMMGVTLDVEDAYRFARGEEVIASNGEPAKLNRPLDFLVVSDHSDGMGVMHRVVNGDPELMKHAELQAMHDGLKAGGEAANAALAIVKHVLDGDYSGPFLDTEIMRTVWQDYVATADRFNDPGTFSTIIGYEWTPMKSGDKLHRNVLYRGDAATAGRVLPYTANDSVNPQDLWQWMETYEETTGGRVLALAHNGNLSGGYMFPVETNPNTGLAIDAEYVKTRARWEPLFEVTQIKGDSEAHPYLSPDDEFADFETWDRGNSTLERKSVPEQFQYEYAREALKNGLQLEQALGSNPYRFGMVGSTDSHTALATAEEDNFFGKMTTNEPYVGRMRGTMGLPSVEDQWNIWETSASGYAAVWATENTREAIWDAMARKEVYATTGPRMTVRFFGGWDFTEVDASFHRLASAGYSRGVPMGGTLQGNGQNNSAPTFLVGALKDPVSGHLDRIQIIKGWLDSEGATHEKIYDVVWGDAHRRTIDAAGKLTPVGNTVDVADASWVNTIGDAELVGVWRDPDFDPSARAVYYVRVIEIPTPRWIVYDAKRFGEEIPAGAHTVLQERAYTSPIWYQPSK